MCVTAVLAAVTVVTAGVGVYSSIQAANARKTSARYENQMRQKQLHDAREMAPAWTLEVPGNGATDPNGGGAVSP